MNPRILKHASQCIRLSRYSDISELPRRRWNPDKWGYRDTEYVACRDSDKKIQLTCLFVADTRTVSHEGSRTGEGTKSGKSLIGAEGIAEESKQTQREVSSNGTDELTLRL